MGSLAQARATRCGSADRTAPGGPSSELSCCALRFSRRGSRNFPLKALRPAPEMFTGWDSLLSEAAVVGFEFGYSLELPKALVLLEAQFGDSPLAPR